MATETVNFLPPEVVGRVMKDGLCGLIWLPNVFVGLDDLVVADLGYVFVITGLTEAVLVSSAVVLLAVADVDAAVVPVVEEAGAVDC